MNNSGLKECLGRWVNKIFFCGAASDASQTVIYVKDEEASKQIQALLSQKAIDDPSFMLAQIKLTPSLKLEKARSLEALLAKLPHETILLDPTAVIERARALVRIVKQARQELGSTLKSCYFNSETRHIHFFLKARSKHTVDLTGLHKQLEPILLRHTQSLATPFSYRITISFTKPCGKVVAIDNQSVVKYPFKNMFKQTLRKLKWPLLIASTSSGLSLAAQAAEPSLPAVSHLNGWIGASGGGLHTSQSGGPAGVGELGIASPFSHSLGVQGHGYYGTAARHSLLSLDGYVFWRDPLQGLVGPHVTYSQFDHFYQTLYGLHGEAYLYNFTPVLEAGGAHQNISGGTYYAEALIHWYANPNLEFHAGGIVLRGDGGGEIGTEYQFSLSSLPGLSIFADAGAGHDDVRYAFLGLRYYFGENKSLIRRHREDNVPATLDLLEVRKPTRVSHIHS